MSDSAQMNALQRALIEKVGHDHGFEHVLESGPFSIVLGSARHDARASVKAVSRGGYLLRFHSVTPALLPELKTAFTSLYNGEGFTLHQETQLSAVLSRAARLARALPAQAAWSFQSTVSEQVSRLPPELRHTEVERLMRLRVGQDRFRDALMDYWGGACAVTGLTLPEALRASHAIPWSECHSDAERLDVFNGFLLVANLDVLFDRFLISFDNGGNMLVSPRLTPTDRQLLGLTPDMRLRWIRDEHRRYLAWHRERWSMDWNARSRDTESLVAPDTKTRQYA